MLDQWKTVWNNLSLRQRITIGSALVLVAAAFFGLSRWQHERDFKPLYTGMSAEDAGAVVAKLKEAGVEFRISEDGSTVSAPSGRQAELRLELASAGLPKTGRIGFELFDKTNLGMTDFAEQVNYRRALEGELERSVRAIAEIESARVHITFPKDSVFLESRTPGKASVLVKIRNGAKLPPQNLAGITHMVASAVEGLAPESVSITDVHGNLLSRPKNSQDAPELSDEALEYRRRIERDLLAKINSTLEPLLGVDKFRAGVSVECDFTSGEQSEETYDPEKSVMTSSQKTEETSSGTASGGIPGSASNLPRPAPRNNGGVSTSRRSETIAFQTSKTVRRIKLPQGSIRRVSASILVDQAVRWEGAGKQQRQVVTPPSAETVRAIRVLVSGAIGLQTDRGDQLVVESLPFESTLQTPAPVETAPVSAPGAAWKPLTNDPRYMGAAAGGLLLLLVAAAYVRRRSKRTRAKATAAAALPEPSEKRRPLPASDAPRSEHLLGESQGEPVPALPVAKLDRLVTSVKTAASDDPALVAGVLRNWLEER
jgi:flagellar M-ring protein FliF